MLKKGIKNNDVKLRFDKIGLNYSFNQYTLEFKAKKIKQYLKLYNKVYNNTKILDIGVAGGELVNLYLTNQCLIGIDISRTMINKAKKLLPGISFIQKDGENLHFKDNTFDVTIFADSLYYMNNATFAINEASRVLKKNGLIILTSRNQLYNKFEPIRQILNIGPSDSLVEKMYYSSELKEILKLQDFKMIDSETFCVIPFKGYDCIDNSLLNRFGHYSIIVGIK